MSNTRKTRQSADDSQTAAAKPKLLGKGHYAIFEAPNGDGVVAFRPEGEDKDSHQVVPAKFWSLALKMLRGETQDLNPMELMKMMMKL